MPLKQKLNADRNKAGDPGGSAAGIGVATRSRLMSVAMSPVSGKIMSPAPTTWTTSCRRSTLLMRV